jgi:hypothetical protein
MLFSFQYLQKTCFHWPSKFLHLAFLSDWNHPKYLWEMQLQDHTLPSCFSYSNPFIKISAEIYIIWQFLCLRLWISHGLALWESEARLAMCDVEGRSSERDVGKADPVTRGGRGVGMFYSHSQFRKHAVHQFLSVFNLLAFCCVILTPFSFSTQRHCVMSLKCVYVCITNMTCHVVVFLIVS